MKFARLVAIGGLAFGWAANTACDAMFCNALTFDEIPSGVYEVSNREMSGTLTVRPREVEVTLDHPVHGQISATFTDADGG